MEHEKQKRCINIDWLEVYCLESADRYPCNAEYYRRQGYMVREREYGTRVYKEMFEILNDNGDPVLEVRRNPASGDADFSGLVPESTHMRLPNWMLYQGNPVAFLMDFLLKHNYIFRRISRIDLAYDFELFDSGDRPSTFVRRYLEGKYRKINQCRLSAHGDDTWNNCNWNSLSWGSRTSMVNTKLYNKTKELEEGTKDKPYIRTTWMMMGLIDNPLSFTKCMPDGTQLKKEIWRLEYSLKSACDGWIVLEMQNGKKMKKQHLPHRLSMFDSKDKLWQRFQDLTFHYFRFKYREFNDLTAKSHGLVLETAHSNYDRPLKRKDRCRDKRLFWFDTDHEFTQLTAAPAGSSGYRVDDVLERRLRRYAMEHPRPDIRQACDIILKEIDLTKLVNYSPKLRWTDARVLQTVLAYKMSGDTRDVADIFEYVIEMLNNDKIF